MIRTIRQFLADQRGAVAVTYALALTALVAIGGVSFDYVRFAALDSELQSAADEAALAAATQLDGKANAITRAQSAVTSYFANSASPVVNRTQMANDQGGSAITGVTFTFYTTFDSTNDTYGAATTVDSAAQVVKVSINARKAFYAFTPIVAAFNSGDLTAAATAGIQAAICKTPPMMVCTPGADFPTTADIGKGMLLQPGSAGAWLPGTFGYVDYGQGANTVKTVLGSNGVIDQCSIGSNVQTQQGNIASAPNYLNTRFDIYQNPLTPADCTAAGANCPAASTRKDLVRKELYTYKKRDSAIAIARPACDSTVTTQTLTGGQGQIDVTEWVSSSEIPSSAAIEGFPRDNCHNSATTNSNGTCGGTGSNIGDGVWNLAGYQASHPNVPVGLTHRYDIYKWERDNPGSGLQVTRVATAPGDGVFTSCNAAGKQCTLVYTNYCSYPSPIKGTYHPTAKDRRVMTVAAVDCSSDTGGAHAFSVNRWMDVFLTQPSWSRNTPYTTASQIYAEIIGPATKADGTNAFQYYGRQKAVLLQ
jgi:Flp pilus assembly protein TadG